MRATRSDAGTVRLTDRDVFALGWLAQMKAISEDDLAVLLGRWSGARPSESATRQTVNRWTRCGVARAQKLLAGKPRMVSLTAGGAALAGESTWHETSVWLAAHQCEVAKARLWLEALDSLPWGTVTEWTSERELRQAAMPKLVKGTRLHQPDGLATFTDGTTAAIEVELSAKGSRRLVEIVEQLTAEHPVTIYLGHDETILRAVLAAYETVKAAEDAYRVGQLYAWTFPVVLP